MKIPKGFMFFILALFFQKNFIALETLPLSESIKKKPKEDLNEGRK
jgi:hypothetical protein